MIIIECLITGTLALAAVGVLATDHGRTYVVRRFRRGRLVRRAMMWSLGILGSAEIACALIPGTPLWLCEASLFAMIILLAACSYVLLTHRIATAPAATTRRVLAIAAHPDDLELACGGTLARMVDAGHEVHAVIMSHGAVGGDASVRPDEARAGGSFLGIEDVEVHDLPDTHLGLAGGEMIRLIEAAIGRVDPHLILTHSKNDQHQDHHAVHEATLRAARQHHSIICFESPSVTKEFSPDIFVDVEDYVQVKVESVLAHRNQAGKPYMMPDVVEGIVTFRGRQAKLSRAEGFETVRLLANQAGVI